MAALGTIVGLAGTGLQAIGTISAGQSAKSQANYQAALYEQQGAYQQAAYQKEAEAEAEKGERLLSRARAVEAASGAGGAETAGGYQSLLDLAKTMESNIQSKVFSGKVASQYGQEEAALSRAKGKSAYSESLLKGLGYGLSGVSKIDTDSFYG